MAITLILGLSLGERFKRSYTKDEYSTEFSKRDKKIEKLEDSIKKIQTKIGL